MLPTRKNITRYLNGTKTVGYVSFLNKFNQQFLSAYCGVRVQGEFVKVSLLLVIGVFLLSACSTTNLNTSNEYLDLIGNKEAVLDYWLVKKKIIPKYPQQANMKKISGCVEFSLVIDSKGKALNPTIIKAFPEGVFDIQAARAIKKWKWIPTETNSNRQPVATTIQHDFVVRNSPNGKDAYKNCKI